MLMRAKLPLLAASAAVLGFCCWMVWFALAPIELAPSPVDFAIQPGSTLRNATRQIVGAGVPMPGWKFTLLARASGAGAGVKAGSYQVFSGVTPLQILRKITRGEFAQSDVVFVEGWTFRQIREVLKAHAYVKHDSENLDDSEVMARLGESGKSPEGMFFPDTYVFARGTSDLVILARAYQAMQKQLQSSWAQRSAGLPIADSYEALILASINAVMHPAATDALYFVSRGDGTSEFSRTLVEHNRAVAKYQIPAARKSRSR